MEIQWQKAEKCPFYPARGFRLEYLNDKFGLMNKKLNDTA